MKVVLLAFRFEQDWVNWILNLTFFTFFSILINGIPSRPFSLTRGILQGDPLSPFLFIIMAEGLSGSIKASVADKSLLELPLHGIDRPISCSHFVDDTLMMGSPKVCESLRILGVLNTFCATSGMDINQEKSQLFFFNTSIQVQHHITNILEFTHSSLLSK